MELEIHKLSQDHAAAISQNRLEDAAQVKKERDSKMIVWERVKQTMAAAFMRNQQLQHARNNSQGQPQPTNNATPSNPEAPPPQPPQIPAPAGAINSQDIPRGPDSQALIQLMQSRAGPNQNTLPRAPGFAVPPNMTPEMASQMQKLVESRGMRPPQPSFPHAQPGQQNRSPVAVTASTQQQSNPQRMTFWEGSLTWTGFHVTTHDKKELRVQVEIASAGDM